MKPQDNQQSPEFDEVEFEGRTYLLENGDPVVVVSVYECEDEDIKEAKED